MKHPVLLKKILKDLLQKYNLEKPLRNQQSVLVWHKVVDDTLKEYTKAVAYKDGKLFIEVYSSSLRNELIFSRETLKKAVNNKIGSSVVKDIIFINRSSNVKTI